jgi:hypothetical protein
MCMSVRMICLSAVAGAGLLPSPVAVAMGGLFRRSKTAWVNSLLKTCPTESTRLLPHSRQERSGQGQSGSI